MSTVIQYTAELTLIMATVTVRRWRFVLARRKRLKPTLQLHLACQKWIKAWPRQHKSSRKRRRRNQPLLKNKRKILNWPQARAREDLQLKLKHCSERKLSK